MWTRNYINLASTILSCTNGGYNGTSTNPFSDGYRLNYKDTSGTVREISNYEDDRSYFEREFRGTFIKREAGNTNSFLSYATVIKDQIATPTTWRDKWNINVGFGSSNAAASVEDYKLDSIISDFTIVSAKATPKLNADGTFTISYQVILNATADISIQEIGLFHKVAYYTTISGATCSRYALINRVVLDNPVSVVSGETANVTFSITTPKITINQ